MEGSTMLELLGMMRNVKPRNVEKDGDSQGEQQELQPAMYQLNLIKDSLGNVPSDTGNFSGLPPCSEQSGLPPCSEQSGLPQCSEQSGLPQCSKQSELKTGMSRQSLSALPGPSFNEKTCPNQTGFFSILPPVTGEGHSVDSFERQPLTVQSKHSFPISQIAHIAHRVQPNQEYGYAVTKHKIMDVLNNPFMCGICGNIFSTTVELRCHVGKDHFLTVPPEDSHNDNREGVVAVSKEEQGSLKSSNYDKNVPGNISETTFVEGNEHNPIGEKITDGEHFTIGEMPMQEKEPAYVNMNKKPGQKMKGKSRIKEEGKRKQLKDGIHESMDREENCSKENTFQKKRRQRIKKADVLDPGKVEGKLEDLNVVSSDPAQVVEKIKEAKSLKCEFCEETFTSNKYRFNHRVASHPDSLFTCPTSNCDKIFKVHEKDKWQHHVRVHNKKPKKPKQDSHSCHVCSMVFRAASSVAIHMETFHPENVQVNKPFCCEVCGKLFRTKRTIKLHQVVHSNKKPYKCGTCGRGFKLESYLKLHLRTHTGEKPFPCKFCDRTFPSTSGRRAHERTHTNDRPYKCSHCGRGYKAKPQLVEHERTHTKEKPFICPICTKAFSSRTSFATHKFLHTGKKPFQCSSCSRAFAQKCNLDHHVRSLHTFEKPHQCTICGVRFARNTSRSMHMEKKHGIKVSLRQERPPLYPEAQDISQIVQAGCVSIDVTSGIMRHTILDETFSLVVESLNG